MLIFVNCAATLLRCYIMWFAALGEAYGFEGICCFVTFSTILHFFGVLLRAYILLSTTSDVLRFAYLLCRDAWRADAFEAYRRLLVGDAWREIEAGEFYSSSWSISLSRCQRAGDIAFQCCLLLSLDVVPLCALGIYMFCPPVAAISFCEVCFFIGLCHILLFYFLWLAGEVSLKIHKFRGAWIAARRGTRHSHPIILDTTSIWVPPEDLQFGSSSTEKRSLCVLCCTVFHWLEYLMPPTVGLLTFTAGIAFHRPHLAILGAGFFVTAMILAMLALQKPDSDSENPTPCTRLVPSFVYRVFIYPEALQHWGEKWCRLGFLQQRRCLVLELAIQLVDVGCKARQIGIIGLLQLTRLPL